MRALAAAAGALALVGCGDSGSFERGAEAYQRGDHETAIRIWTPLAEKGNVQAQINLGLMHANGEGVPQDDVETVKWFRLAADQGDANAQYNLAGMFASGRGTQLDAKKAIKWLRRAAEQGLAAAQFNLGAMYHNGENVERDPVQALFWFLLAAEQGNKEAAEGVVAAASAMSDKRFAEATRLAREWQPKPER